MVTLAQGELCLVILHEMRTKCGKKGLTGWFVSCESVKFAPCQNQKLFKRGC